MCKLDFESEQLALRCHISNLTGQVKSQNIELEQTRQKNAQLESLCWVLLGLLIVACVAIVVVVRYAN